MMLSSLIQNKFLKDLCTFGIGGPAKYYVEVRSIPELQAALTLCRREKLAYFILGKGSNCLFDDRGFDGVVIHNRIEFFEQSEGLVYVGAGYSFPRLGSKVSRDGWSGLEFAGGIPCSVGGAVFMNAGANGAETANHLVKVEYVDPAGQLIEFSKEQLTFRYRYSSFQEMPGAIASATFQLSADPQAKSKQTEIVRYRTATQPYGDKSAGCLFRNAATAPAGRLIEQCGLKGVQLGGAKVSELHANFVINAADATAQDVLALMQQIKETVKKQTGIELEAEVRCVPYSKQVEDVTVR